MVIYMHLFQKYCIPKFSNVGILKWKDYHLYNLTQYRIMVKSLEIHLDANNHFNGNQVLNFDI